MVKGYQGEIASHTSRRFIGVMQIAEGNYIDTMNYVCHYGHLAFQLVRRTHHKVRLPHR